MPFKANAERRYHIPKQRYRATNSGAYGVHNRLGYALMLCTLRHPGRALRAGERPLSALVHFAADQLDV